MKKKILSIIAIMIVSVSMVLAVQVDDKNKVLRTELSAEIEKNLTDSENGYQNLRIDETFDVEKVNFNGMHSVYKTIDTDESDFIFENRYVTAATYNNVEIADIYYTIRNDQVIDVKVVLDKSNEDKDVLLNEAIRQMPAIENKDEISLYTPNDKTAVAFTETTYKMFVVKDELNRYESYVVNEADGTKTIERNEFFRLHEDHKIKNNDNHEFVKNATILEIILILLLAILSILAFLSYITLNSDRINLNKQDKKVSKEEKKEVATKKAAPAKKAATTKKTTARKAPAKKATTAKKTTTKKTK